MKKAEYKTPEIKMVEFKVEVGQVGSITGLAGSDASNPWEPNSNGTDGTQTYFGNRSFE